MGRVLDAAVKMHRHAPRVIREVSPPPPKAQVAHLRRLTPAPYLADLSRRPGASMPASAPELRQASLLPQVGRRRR